MRYRALAWRVSPLRVWSRGRVPLLGRLDPASDWCRRPRVVIAGELLAARVLVSLSVPPVADFGLRLCDTVMYSVHLHSPILWCGNTLPYYPMF